MIFIGELEIRNKRNKLLESISNNFILNNNIFEIYLSSKFSFYYFK